MTPSPDPADLPAPWPDALAAYADGELTDADRAAVERWLDVNPDARRCVDAQRRLSPENWRLWCKASPPRPSPEAWDAVRDGIAAQLAARRHAEPARRASPWKLRYGGAFAVAACALCACVMLVVALNDRLLARGSQRVVERSLRALPDDPLAGIPVLLIAAEAEVDVHRVDGAGAGGWLPVGGMPLTGPLTLATADDVELEEAEDHPAWPTGGPRMTRNPTDAPLLFPGATR